MNKSASKKQKLADEEVYTKKEEIEEQKMIVDIKHEEPSADVDIQMKESEALSQK